MSPCITIMISTFFDDSKVQERKVHKHFDHVFTFVDNALKQTFGSLFLITVWKGLFQTQRKQIMLPMVFGNFFYLHAESRPSQGNKGCRYGQQRNSSCCLEEA